MTEQTSLLHQLQAHLSKVQHDPSVPLDEKLFDSAIYTLLPTLPPKDTQALIFQIYQLFPQLQQSPDPAIRLLSKLLEPVALSNILSLEPPVDLIGGLDVAAAPFNQLTLDLLAKADANSARTLASAYPQLFISLVVLWLSTELEGVADTAGKVLINLLKLDLPEAEKVGLDGPVWKRVFRDKDVYEKILAITDTKTGRDRSLGKNRKTIAQARLLNWLPVVGSLSWSSITQSYHPEIEATFGLPKGEQSLLHYAALHMVDYASDILMHRTLIAFCESLLVVNPGNSNATSPALEFLIHTGLHKRTMSYYTDSENPSHDPLDATFLYGPAAMYTGRWVETYPQDLMGAQNDRIRHALFDKITKAVQVSTSRWAISYSPSEDLHVLASLPRPLLVSMGPDNPLLSIPSRAANTEALNCLATVFHGPMDVVTFPARISKPHEVEEVKAAETLYLSYLAHNERLWSDVVMHADTVALKDQALAAISVVKSIITARWNGVSAIVDGPAKADVIPWLLAPSKTFSNLVGGHGDAESAAYKIASAKFDALKALYSRIMGEEAYGDVAVVAQARICEGAFGTGQQSGSRIATMEL